MSADVLSVAHEQADTGHQHEDQDAYDSNDNGWRGLNFERLSMRNFRIETDGLVLGADCDGLGRAVNQIQALVQTDPHLGKKEFSF